MPHEHTPKELPDELTGHLFMIRTESGEEIEVQVCKVCGVLFVKDDEEA